MRKLLMLLAATHFGVALMFGQTIPGGHQPFLNLSSRVTITPDNPRVIVGFSVPAHDTNPNLVKVVLIRAIGPGLADHGIASPLPDPIVHVYDAFGNDRSWNYDSTRATNRDGTTDDVDTRATIFEDVAETAEYVGAFPVPVPTADTLTVPDYSMVGGFSEGTYTVVVESASGGTGDVLVELYAVSL